VAECPPVLASMFGFAANDWCDIHCPFRFDDMMSVCRPTDDMLLSYADVIIELAMVRDGVLVFTDSHFYTANACSFIEFLCTV